MNLIRKPLIQLFAIIILMVMTAFYYQYKSQLALRKPSSLGVSNGGCTGILAKASKFRGILESEALDPANYAPLIKLGNRIQYGKSYFGLGKMIIYKSSPGSSARSLEKIDKLTIGAYNLLNLFGPEDIAKFPDATLKPDWQRQGVANMIKQINPDIMGMEEVGHFNTLQEFADKELEGRWQPLMLYGNSDRGINVAFLIKKDLPIQIEMHSFADITGKYMGKEVKIFSRDYPVLLIKRLNAPETEAPLMIFSGVHLKSQRFAPGDQTSSILRQLQAFSVMKVKQMIQDKFGKSVPYVIAGDFNADLSTASELTTIRNAGFEDALDVAQTPFEGERFTHYYRGHGAQLDGVLVSPGMTEQKMVLSADIQKYVDGGDANQKAPSDHNPVMAVLDFKKIWQLFTNSIK